MTLGHVDRQLGFLPLRQTVEVGVRPGNWELTLDNVGRQLGCLSLRQTVEVGVRPWCWEVGVWQWCWEIEIVLRVGVLLALSDYKRLLRIVSLSLCRRTKLRRNVCNWIKESCLCISPTCVFVCLCICICIRTVVIDISLVVSWSALPFPWIAPLTFDPYLTMPSVKQGHTKYYFLSLWYDSTRDWTLVSLTTGKHSNH